MVNKPKYLLYIAYAVLIISFFLKMSLRTEPQRTATSPAQPRPAQPFVSCCAFRLARVHFMSNPSPEAFWGHGLSLQYWLPRADQATMAQL